MTNKKQVCGVMFLMAVLLCNRINVFAEDGTGRPGAFLRMGVGMRGLAMGNAFVAIADDPSASYWNPAGLSQIQTYGLELMYLEMPLDRTFRFIGTSLPISKIGTFSLSWIGLQINNLEARTSNTSQPDYYFTDSENAFLFSYGRTINDLISLGINVKWLYHQLDDESASGFGFDGSFLITPGDNLKIGFSYNDIGTSMKWTSGYTDIFPGLIRLGASYLFPYNVTVSAGLENINRQKTSVHVGAELKTKKDLSFQLGLSQNQLTSGMNVKLELANLDMKIGYGIRADNLSDQYIHLVSLNLTKHEEIDLRQNILVRDKSNSVKIDKSRKTLIVKASVLNVRNGPDKRFKILGTVKSGDGFAVHDEKDGWLLIQFAPNRFGWISRYYVSFIH